MKLALQLLRHRIHPVEILSIGCPARRLEVHPPPAFSGALPLPVGAGQRRPFIKVAAQRVCLVSFGGVSTRFQDPPPRDATAVVAHDRTDLAGSPGTQQFRDVAIRYRGSRRHHPYDGKDRLHILNPH